MPAQIGAGVLGVPFITPPAGTPRFLATLWTLGLYFFVGIAFAAVTFSAVRFWRDRDASRLYILFAACGALLVPLGLLASWKLWAAGKALLMAAPFLFAALMLPLLRSDLSTVWRAVPALIASLHFWFGVDRLPASTGEHGIHRPAPYPIWRPFKTSHDWDIGRFKEALQRCRRTALGISQPHMSRYIQIFLSDLNLQWHSLRPLNSYYGFGKGIDLGVQSVTTPADCLLVDNVDDFVPADRVFWVGANRQQAAFLLGERLTLSLAPRVPTTNEHGVASTTSGLYGVEPYRGEQLQWTNGEARLSFLDSPSSTARYVRIALWEINMVDRVSVVVNGVVLLDRVAPWQGSWVGHIPPATVVKTTS